MNKATPRPVPIGLMVNRIVATRVRALADEYGDISDGDDAPADRRRHLAGLLCSVMRSLRLEAVDGERFRVVRSGDAIRAERVVVG